MVFKNAYTVTDKFNGGSTNVEQVLRQTNSNDEFKAI